MPFGCPFCCEMRPSIDDLKSHATSEHASIIAEPMNDDGYTFDDYIREEAVYWTVRGMASNEEIAGKTWDDRRQFVTELVGDIQRKELMVLRIMTNLWPCRHFHEMVIDDCCPNRAAHHEYMMLIAAESGEEE